MIASRHPRMSEVYRDECGRRGVDPRAWIGVHPGSIAGNLTGELDGYLAVVTPVSMDHAEYLGPDVDQPRWEWVTPGSAVAAFLWIGASALFAVYTATFASYNKTWGTLSAVIVMLTWLWLTAMALLLGAEINAEAMRGRNLRTRA